jgi:catechol 2,3-dioxygenase-like lactoylglutathione lyase family enzyme
VDLRLRQMALVVKDIEKIVGQFEAVFGLEVGYEEEAMPPGPIGMQNRLLPIGTQFIELVSPVRPEVTGQRYLERRGGDGGYMVICQTTDRARRDELVKKFGVRLVGGRDDTAYSFIQYHPKDTGGSFLEVDWHEGADDPVPPWSHAAGTDWMKAVHTDVIDAITGVEIQVPDPEASARRWGELLELTVTKDPQGRPTITANNGTIRFVGDLDGRGEGLAGLDLHATNKVRAIENAKAAGVPVNGNTVVVAGMRLNLV